MRVSLLRDDPHFKWRKPQYSVQIRDVGRFLAKLNPWTNTYGNRLVTQCPTVTLEERSKRRNFGRITPNFGLFQWIRRHFWCFD